MLSEQHGEKDNIKCWPILKYGNKIKQNNIYNYLYTYIQTRIHPKHYTVYFLNWHLG